MTISDQSSKTIVLRFFCCGLSGASLPSCFSEAVRVREANLNVLENMSSKEPMYSAEQALEKIWNDSGDEGDLTAMKVNLRCIRRAKMKVTSLVLMPLHQGKIVLNTRRRVVMMKLKVAEMVETVFAKGRQDDKKLLFFGEWHVEQHHVLFRLPETLESRY